MSEYSVSEDEYDNEEHLDTLYGAAETIVVELSGIDVTFEEVEEAIKCTPEHMWPEETISILRKIGRSSSMMKEIRRLVELAKAVIKKLENGTV